MAANLPEEARRWQVRLLGPRSAAPDEVEQIDYGRLGRWLNRSPGSCGPSGIRDGAGLFAAHVRPAGTEDGPAGVDRVSCRGVRLL